MTVTTPWGLSRATERLTESPLPYQTAKLDPDTQTSRFYDATGGIVDMITCAANKTFVTVTYSKGGGSDGSSGSSQVADDSNTDVGSD